jgi:hypothetical protein
LRLVDELADSLKPLVQSAGAGGRFVENGLSSYQAYEITRTATEPKLQEALAEKVMREKIPHPQIREIRKALQSVPGDSVEVRQRILDAPWSKTALEISREAGVSQLPNTITQSPAASSAGSWHDKSVWNAQRCASYGVEFFTMSYSERTIAQFLELLNAAGIKTLVDTRADPVSQFKPSFSKNNLGTILAKEFISYVHMRGLGVPRTKRKQLREGKDYESFFQWYDREITPLAVEKLLDPTLTKPVAILCVELAPTKCHRHRIAIALEAQGFLTFDL